MNQQIKFKNNDVLHVNSKKVSCDGGTGSSKHPLVYLNMGEKDFVVCPYCSKYFSLNNSKNSTNLLNKNNKN
jgi:uncharacterized Zn-finger protein